MATRTTKRTYKSKTRYQPIEVDEQVREQVAQVVASFEELGVTVTKRSVVNAALAAGLKHKYGKFLA